MHASIAGIDGHISLKEVLTHAYDEHIPCGCGSSNLAMILSPTLKHVSLLATSVTTPHISDPITYGRPCFGSCIISVLPLKRRQSPGANAHAKTLTII